VIMAVAKANRSKTICPVCSLQDGLILQWKRSSPRFTEESLITVDYDSDNLINEGSLCPRGNAVAELVDHPQRLVSPRVDGKEVSWKDALSRIATSLKKLAKKYGPEALGILVGGGLTLEETLAVGKLAGGVLGTPNVAALLPDDGVVFHRLAHLGWDVGFSLQDLQDRQVMLLVGDVFMEHPVISKRILRAKYKDRPHRLFVLDSVASQTAGFAHQHLQPRPGTEALVLAGIAQMLSGAEGVKSESFSLRLDLPAVAQRTGVSQEQMGAVASALSSARDGAVVQSNLYGRLGLAGACALLGHALTRLAPGKFTFLHLPVFWNGQGVYRMLSSGKKGPKNITGPQLLELVMDGKIKGLLLFGLDPLSAVPSEKLDAALKKLDLLCVVDVLPTHTTALAHVVLPAAIGPEKSGQVLYLNGDLQEFQPAVPFPGAAKPEGEIIEQLAYHLSPKGEFSVVTAQEVQEKLKGNGRASWTEMLAELGSDVTGLLSADEAEDTAYPLYLVPASVPAHLGDGSLTRHFGWAQKVCRAPIIWASASLMEKLKLHQGDRVQISSKVDQAIFPLALDGSLPEKVISAPAHFPEVRRLFSWNLDPRSGELELGPERVLLSKPKERS
jgi:anaerobic selenocysteine-containing dehydrogenase